MSEKNNKEIEIEPEQLEKLAQIGKIGTLKICPICREEIKLQEVNSYFKIPIGNFINGKFYDNKTYYYHKDCLNEKSPREEMVEP